MSCWRTWLRPGCFLARWVVTNTTITFCSGGWSVASWVSGRFGRRRLERRVRLGRWAFVALFFDPIIPVHLTRQTWGFIDVEAALLLLVSIVAVDLRPPSTPSSNAGTIPPGQREDDRVE